MKSVAILGACVWALAACNGDKDTDTDTPFDSDTDPVTDTDTGTHTGTDAHTGALPTLYLSVVDMRTEEGVEGVTVAIDTLDGGRTEVVTDASGGASVEMDPATVSGAIAHADGWTFWALSQASFAQHGGRFRIAPLTEPGTSIGPVRCSTRTTSTTS